MQATGDASAFEGLLRTVFGADGREFLREELVIQLRGDGAAVVELGAKWLLLDGDLALRTALYRATKHWERNADLESTAAILTRKRRTDGPQLPLEGTDEPTVEQVRAAGLVLQNPLRPPR